MKRKTVEHSGFDCVESVGPWPFITRRIYQHRDGSKIVWHSREHRKQLVRNQLTEASKLFNFLWMPKKLNWWIGIIFAIGALCFAVAGWLSLNPTLARSWSLDLKAVNTIFFIGSIPFTTASYLQLYQSANTEALPRGVVHNPKKTILFGWCPTDIGWLSCILQFIGTIMFNVSTFNAMKLSLPWLLQDILICTPNLLGSILFLISGYLAFIEVCHSYWAFKPRSICWWIGLSNLLGCIGFIISAGFAIVLPSVQNVIAAELSLLFTVMGALFFFVGAALMLPEAGA